LAVASGGTGGRKCRVVLVRLLVAIGRWMGKKMGAFALLFVL